AAAAVVDLVRALLVEVVGEVVGEEEEGEAGAQDAEVVVQEAVRVAGNLHVGAVEALGGSAFLLEEVELAGVTEHGAHQVHVEVVSDELAHGEGGGGLHVEHGAAQGAAHVADTNLGEVGQVAAVGAAEVVAE